MKTIFITLTFLLGVSSGVLAQRGKIDPVWHKHITPIYLTISGTYRMGMWNTVCKAPARQKNCIGPFKKNYPTRKYYLTVTIHNSNPAAAYTDINYEAQFFTKDGTFEGVQTYITRDTVCQGASLALKKQQLECPKDCKTINVKFISSTMVK
jgi:hypothetical protein